MNESNSKKNKKLFIIMLVLGIIFLIVGLYNLISYESYYKKGDKVEARVVNVLTYPDSNDDLFEKELEHYKALLQEYKSKGIIKENTNVAIIIMFDYNNKSYEKELGYFSNDLHIGQLVTIYIKDSNPNDFMYGGKNKFSIYASLIIGGTLSLIALISIIMISHNERANRLLLKEGYKVKAKVLYCDANEKIEKFNRHPYILTCIYIDEDTKEELVFTSDSIFLKNTIDNYIDKYVYVYIDKNNKNNYYVNVEKFLDK